MTTRCKHERQRPSPGEQTRHSGKRYTLRPGRVAGPQPPGPGRTRQSLPYRVHVRNTPAAARSTWAAFARSARDGARISQADLARRLDVDRTTVYRWESGSTRPDNVELVIRFAAVLDIDPEEALAAAGFRPGVDAPKGPTRPPDPELDRIRQSKLTPAAKQRLTKRITERREREQQTRLADLEDLIRAQERLER